MDNISIVDNNNLRLSESPRSHVQGDPNVFINSNIVQVGDDVTVQVGSTETLPADSQAYVRNSGTEKNVVLDFGLVSGANGRDGVDGSDGLNGVDGFSPIATVTPIEGGATISVTDATHRTTANIYDGADGADGFSPIANVTQNTGSATISVTDSLGTTSATVYDGISPTATVTPITGGAEIVITGASGTTTATVYDGVDGTNGTDGYSPTATVTPTATGATISITDQQGTTTANITNGTDGTDGTDGVTPSITATASVDNTTGTPAVTVTKTGTDANPSFAFAFEHLKGDTGAAGTTDWNGITNKPNFATVATSGSYNDLSNKPTIPTQYFIKAGTETIPALNSGGYTEINVSIPTQNDTNYAVALTLSGSTSFWTWLRCIAINKTINSFTIGVYNDGSGSTGSIPIDYIVMKS